MCRQRHRGFESLPLRHPPAACPERAARGPGGGPGPLRWGAFEPGQAGNGAALRTSSHVRGARVLRRARGPSGHARRLRLRALRAGPGPLLRSGAASPRGSPARTPSLASPLRRGPPATRPGSVDAPRRRRGPRRGTGIAASPPLDWGHGLRRPRPQVPPWRLRRGRRAGGGQAHPSGRPRGRPGRSRLPLRRAAGHGQDHHGTHLRQGAELRAGARPRALQRLRSL